MSFTLFSCARTFQNRAYAGFNHDCLVDKTAYTVLQISVYDSILEFFLLCLYKLFLCYFLGASSL